MYTYPRPQNLAYPARVLFDGGRFLEAILLSDRARAGRTGAPGRSTRLVTKVERREAQRPTSLGARGWRYQLREVGTLFPPLRVPRKHSGASRRSITLAQFARDCEASDATRRENAEAWLFETWIKVPFPGRAAAFFTLLRRAGIVPSTVLCTARALQRPAPKVLGAARRRGNGTYAPAAAIS